MFRERLGYITSDILHQYTISNYLPVDLPFLSFWLTPVSENERACPRDPRPDSLWPSENDEHLGAGGARELRCMDSSRFSPSSLLCVELRDSWRLRCPRLPIARYSGPSSYSPSPESPVSSWGEGEGDSVREMDGTGVGPRGWLTPRSLSPALDTHTQGTPRLLGREVVSATEQVQKEKKRIRSLSFHSLNFDLDRLRYHNHAGK